MRKEGIRSFSKVVISALEYYLKKFGRAENNQTKISSFEDSDFVACPAFYRDRNTWHEYINSITKEEYKEFDAKLNTILYLANQRFGRL